ncbi:HET-domain-containing protein [Hypomontagnella monticulosa]|nr:HET-domain-containing protein [Hypomontagnella monticulosa]
MEKAGTSEAKTQDALVGLTTSKEDAQQATEASNAAIQPATKSASDLDDEALAQLVEEMATSLGGAPGTFHADGGYSEPGKEDDIGRQVLMASLRRGFFSNEPIAVGVDGKIDLEYGNQGIEINPAQQLTNSGYLSARADSTRNAKQERYRSLRMWGRLAGPLGEELKALEDDEDVHSVSVISGGIDTNTDNFSPCAIDCWLKAPPPELATPQYSPAIFDAMRWEASPKPGTSAQKGGIYSSLPENHTRILILEPASYGEGISCSLVNHPCAGTSPEASTSGISDYEALSYTWGDPSPKFVIQCNGQTLPIAHNLFFALQQLRHATTKRYLWIDAVCINQNDIAERNTQIQHMLSIYQNAARVLVWLGVESETSPLAMEAMRRLDEHEVRKGVMYRVHELSCYEQLKKACDAISELLERPWFTRSWIRQELTVAKDVVVSCGQESVSWYILKRSAARLGHFTHKLSKESKLPISAPESTRYNTAISYLTRGWSYGQSVTGILGSIRSIWYYHNGGLLELLMTGRHFDATDPRDRVYSVLGLGLVPMKTTTESKQVSEKSVVGSVSSAPSFPVDYGKTVSEVYQDTVKYFINRDSNLDILALLITARNDGSTTDLPSWVPDWRVPASEVSITTHWDFISLKIAASGLHSKAEPQSHDEKGVLRCKGILIDRLEKRSEYTASAYETLALVPGFPGGEQEEEVEKPRERTLIVREVDPLKDRTRCFETEMGLACLAPAWAREGDEVALIHGGKHAFVIRPLGTAKLSGSAELTDGARPFQFEVIEYDDTTTELSEEDGSEYMPAFEMVGPCISPDAMFGGMAKSLEERDIAPTMFVLV